VADVRGEAVDLAFVAVEGKGVAAPLGHPEVTLKPRAEVVGALLESGGQRLVVPDVAREARRAPLRVVDRALDLAGGDRPLRKGAVGGLDRVPAVFPALVDQAGGRVAPLVLDVPVAVAVPAVLDPGQGGARWAPAPG
jgi:hypothetical protein